ncbi:DUF3592 domain-containing protein [Streptosporangium sp. NPDC000239]|uniref:DUF3592 domain-containing protein n=1 Tax=Streptosporangium sp. NPDC000239 TaxID=3154248 RepID=UPI0033250BE3
MARRLRWDLGPGEDEEPVDDGSVNGVYVIACVLLCVGWAFTTILGVRVGASHLDMYLHGGRTTATAMSTRTVKAGESYQLTKVNFFVKDVRRFAEIRGSYAEGEKVSIVYDADDPSVVNREFRLVFDLLLLGAFFVMTLYAVFAGLRRLWKKRRRPGLAKS